MRIRVLLFVLILAGVAGTGLNLSLVQQRVTRLKSALQQQTTARQNFEAKARLAQAELAKTTVALNETKTALREARAETERAKVALGAQVERAQRLGGDLAKVTHDRDEAQVSLSLYLASRLTPEQAVNARNRISDLERDLADSRKQALSLKNEVAGLKNQLVSLDSEPPPVLLPAALKGKVLVFDPKWHFVVFDAGEEQGALPAGELLVSRDGHLVGKVKIDRVEKDRSIATLMPGWQLGDVLEGDVLTPAHPGS